MATIRDVANLAGVSTATVSHVLNDTRSVSDELRERVLTAMADLSYRPSAVARSLRVSETLTIGLIVPDVEIPFYARVARCMESAANAARYSIILCNSRWSLDNELRYLDDLMARRVDGLICISLLMTQSHIEPVLRRNTPVVWFEQPRVGSHFDAVITDNFAGAYAATAHLISMGHRRIGCIEGLAQAQLTTDRLAGYREALADHGLAFDETLVAIGDYTPATGWAGAQSLLDLAEPPTAIFAFNDLMALGVMQAINERGLRIPNQVAVVGFDGIALTEHTSPPLTTVEQPVWQMCEAAMKLLLDRINGTTSPQVRTLTIAPRLVVRASTVGTAARPGIATSLSAD